MTNSLQSILLQQYGLVKNSRSVLHAYCNQISEAHFTQEVAGFGRGGSIRNLLVHITNTYNFWIGHHCLRMDLAFTEYNSIPNMEKCVLLYEAVDRLMIEFIEHFKDSMFEEIHGDTTVASPFKVFAHVTSHEFHHKGQVVSISRHLGYTPVDTDIMR